MSRTKELTQQIADCHKFHEENMRNLEEQREQAIKEEKYDEAAQELRNMYDSYIRAGFTEEQAWELVTIVMNNSTKRTLF